MSSVIAANEAAGITAKRLPDYIEHMLEAVGQSCSYVEGMPKLYFLDDKRTQQADIKRALAIAKSAGPFGPFSEAMRRKADQIVVVSRFKFTRDETLRATTLSTTTTNGP